MKFKILEVRDEGTHIPVMAMQMMADTPVQGYYIHGRCGYSKDGQTIVLMRLDDQKATSDMYGWADLGLGNRTMPNAHRFIEENFNTLVDGDVVDVRVILGESKVAAVSDRFYNFAAHRHEAP